MNEHYYTPEPQSMSDERRFELEFEGEKYSFIYDNGVFSKGRLDDGTRILLSAVETVSGDVLDLGCGWGPVGTILARRFPAARILMTDVNERALRLSEKNLKLNRVENARTLASDGFTSIEGCFDCILTNPPIRAGKQTIYGMFDDALHHLKPGGALYIVIRRQQGAESALKYLEKANAQVILRDKGYWVIRCGREGAR
ncbi:MAG: class I SAM-dependent methyltransferase [Clostridia bacterium]|nr:class I SAM-dependent methyltransferase [Clostridia bacterium]